MKVLCRLCIFFIQGGEEEAETHLGDVCCLSINIDVEDDKHEG